MGGGAGGSVATVGLCKGVVGFSVVICVGVVGLAVDGPKIKQSKGLTSV